MYMLAGAMPLQAPRRDREMAGEWLAVGANDASGMVVWRPATLQEDGQRAAAARTRKTRLMGGVQRRGFERGRAALWLRRGLASGRATLWLPDRFSRAKGSIGNFDPGTLKKQKNGSRKP